jgi:5-methylcytosine-specific restriction endonuclease McrBC regulatory subunit McrC
MNETSAANQKVIRHILRKLNEVSDIKCTPSDCNQLRLSKLHKNYSVILSMSKMFLLNKIASYNVDDTESFCFLFPTEVLFEGFVGGFMQSVLGTDGKVRLQASELSLIDNIVFEGEDLGRAFTMRHDILAEYQGKVFVLDTKYKQVRRFKGNSELKQTIVSDVSQADLYQISTYAAKRGLSDGYLLYPMYRYEAEEPSAPELKQTVSVDGIDRLVTIHLVRLPFVFEDDVEHTKKMIAESIQRIFQ